MSIVCGRRNLLLLLSIFCCAAGAMAQTRPLNPVVRVLPRATAPVPAECEEGLAPQPAQRVERDEITAERDTSRDLEAPPSRDLRSQLEAAQNAAERNDRESFRAALENAKSFLSSYPPGGERTAAANVVSVYDDLDRLWEHQYSSPTGAFFGGGTEDGALLGMLTKYRGYEEFIRTQTFVDANGTRWYPTSESREFLTREAGQRLTTLGFPSRPTRREPATRVARPAPAPEPALGPRPSTLGEPPRKTPRRTTQTARAEKPHKRRGGAPMTAPAHKKTVTPKEEIPPSPPIVSTPSSAPVSSPSPAPTETTATETTATETTATETTPTETTPTATETTATETTASQAPAVETAATTDTTSSAPAQPAQPAKQRSILLPLMLILIGAGVLILLFRASS